MKYTMLLARVCDDYKGYCPVADMHGNVDYQPDPLLIFRSTQLCRLFTVRCAPEVARFEKLGAPPPPPSQLPQRLGMCATCAAAFAFLTRCALLR